MAKYEIENNKKFQAALNAGAKKVNDLRIPLTIISKQWFKSNLALFKLKGPGKFEDLTEAYKIQKKKPPPRGAGFIYPILLGKTEKLKRSITDPKDSNSVNQIINKKSLFLGTQVTSKKGHPYAKSLHFGTDKMAARPFVLIGAEQTGPAEFNLRVEAWIFTLNKYIEDKMDEIARKTP